MLPTSSQAAKRSANKLWPSRKCSGTIRNESTLAATCAHENPTCMSVRTLPRSSESSEAANLVKPCRTASSTLNAAPPAGEELRKSTSKIEIRVEKGNLMAKLPQHSLSSEIASLRKQTWKANSDTCVGTQITKTNLEP